MTDPFARLDALHERATPGGEFAWLLVLAYPAIRDYVRALERDIGWYKANLPRHQHPDDSKLAAARRKLEEVVG